MADAIRRVERRKTIIVTGASEKCDVSIENLKGIFFVMCGRESDWRRRVNCQSVTLKYVTSSEIRHYP